VEDFSDEKYFLDISNYSSHRNTDQSTRMMKKLLVSLAMENSLLSIGEGTLAKTVGQHAQCAIVAFLTAMTI
jgi:hypothetical protein